MEQNYVTVIAAYSSPDGIICAPFWWYYSIFLWYVAWIQPIVPQFSQHIVIFFSQFGISSTTSLIFRALQHFMKNDSWI